MTLQIANLAIKMTGQAIIIQVSAQPATIRSTGNKLISTTRLLIRKIASRATQMKNLQITTRGSAHSATIQQIGRK
jgi:hypothetical protein